MDASAGKTDAAPAYHAEDRAVLLGFYKWLFWDRLVAAFPASLKPNTITIFGESCAIVGAVATWAASRGTPALYLVSAALFFIYMTGDNVDGPHARRTRQTSVLGEFLDHGLDGLASCALLLSSAFILRLDAVAMAGLAALGGVGFFTTFWAQYRTGLLVTPQVGAMEGVTGTVVFQIGVFALGDPAWLRFSTTTCTPATAIVGVLVAFYLFAIVVPIARARRAGARAREVGPVALVVAAIAIGARGEVGGVLPAFSLSLVIAELVCRMILFRNAGAQRAVLRPAHGLLALPWLAAAAGLGPSLIWAWLGAGAAAASYAWTFGRGCAQLAALRRA